MPPGGGQSHSGGDAYVRLKRPPFSASLSPIDPIFFTVAWALTQRPIFFHLICHSMPHDLKSWHLKKKCYVFHLFFTVQPRGLTFLLHRHQTGSQVVLVQCFVLSTTQRPYFFVNFWLSPDDPTYFCIFLSLNAKNHALTQWPLIFWACALTECPSLLEGGPYTRIHFIFDCPPDFASVPTSYDLKHC